MFNNKIIKMFLFSILFVTAAYSQDMKPPKPIENKLFDAMVGEWSGEGTSMGVKVKQDVKVYWDLNHQFLITELKSQSIDNPADTYQGLGISGIDMNGNIKNWWFDVWGTMGVSTGTGAFDGNKMIGTAGNDFFQFTSNTEVKDNKVTRNAKGWYMNANMQKVNFEESVVFNKK